MANPETLLGEIEAKTRELIGMSCSHPSAYSMSRERFGFVLYEKYFDVK